MGSRYPAAALEADFGATWHGRPASADSVVGPLRITSLNGRGDARGGSTSGEPYGGVAESRPCGGHAAHLRPRQMAGERMREVGAHHVDRAAGAVHGVETHVMDLQASSVRDMTVLEEAQEV